MKKLLLSIISLLLLSACSPTLNLGVGYSFLPTIPSEYVTGHEQFQLNAELEQELDDHWSVIGGWQHYSNGSKLGIGRQPNHGIDAGGIRLQYRIPLGF